MQRKDQFIHEYSAQSLLSILQNNAWQANGQSISSAITNQDNIDEPDAHYLAIGENASGPTAFSDFTFDSTVKKVLDIGGGRFDCNKHYLKKMYNIDLSIWDPFNRSKEHNDRIFALFSANKADAVTSMSVLNVIPELEARLAHLATLKDALTIGGKCYIKIWPGELPYKGSYIPTATDQAYQANAYADRFIREVELVFGLGNVFLNKHIANFIIAIKQSDKLTSIQSIEEIQIKSKQDVARLSALKDKALKKIHSQISIMSLFRNNLSLFNQAEKTHLEQNRQVDTTARQAYDKRWGLILKR